MFRTYRFWLCAAIAWASLAGICLVEIWPQWPQTKQHWLLLVAAGPPIYIVLEWLAEKVITPTGDRVQDQSAVSLKRVFVLLIRLGVFLVAFGGAVTIVRGLFNR